MEKDEDEEAFRARLNEKLPSDVRVFCVTRCSNRFNAKNCTSNREYSYYLPTFMMTKISDLYFGTGKNSKPTEPPGEKDPKEEEKKPASGIKIMKNEDEDKQFENQDAYIHKNIDHIPASHYEKLYQFRLSEGDKARVQKLFQFFLGTKKYHNYSKEVKPHQTTAMRYMIELRADTFMYINRETFDVTTEDDPNAIQFIHFFLKGQAFLYNQIRKMVGSIIQVFRGGLDDSFLNNTFNDNYVSVCLAPGDGLLLEQVCYDKYNQLNDNKKSEIMLKYVAQSKEVLSFREDIVRQIAKRELTDKAFSRWISVFDDFCEDYYIPRPAIADKVIAATE